MNRVAISLAILLCIGLCYATQASEVDFHSISTAYRTWRCNECQLEVASLKNDRDYFNMTKKECMNTLRSTCDEHQNSTIHSQCTMAVDTICSEVMGEDVNACQATGICSLDSDPEFGNLWRGCGACTKLVRFGLNKSEKYVCHGLMDPLAGVCNAGAPICELALNQACNWVLHQICDNTCVAEWICHKFKACGSGPGSTCCHL